MILRIGVVFLVAVAVVRGLPQQGQGAKGENLDALIDCVFGGNGNCNNNNNNGNANNPPPQPTPDLPVPITPPQPPPEETTRETRDNPEDNDDCTCVPYYLCPNGTVLTDGTGLLDIRAKQGACEKYMDVCCQNPLDESQPIKPKPTSRNGCGQRHPDGVGFRITGDKDNESQFGEFPWMVALLRKTVLDDGSDLSVYQCGGALIHERVVLTAAHCVTGNADGELIARVGEWDTQTNNEVYRHQNVKVSKVIVHPGFKKGNLHNDFALLLLEAPVTLGENVDTVCLPPQPGYVPLSNECYATGWGKDKFDEEDEPTSKPIWQHRRSRRHLPILSGIRQGIKSLLEGFKVRGIVGSVWPSSGKKTHGKHIHRNSGSPGEKGTYQVILKKIDLPIVPKEQCVSLLRKTRLGPFYKLHDSFLCAGGVVGKDTCKGDGGSPLVCPIEGKPGTYEVTGLVAWGIGCGDETPGVYAGVAYAKPWIEREVKGLGIQLES